MLNRRRAARGQAVSGAGAGAGCRCEEVREGRRRLAGILDEVLPSEIVVRLEQGHRRFAECFEDVTVLFADMVGFSERSRSMAPTAIVELLNRVFSEFDRLALRHGVQKIGSQGDSYLAVAGLPRVRADHAAAAAALALALQAAMTGHRTLDRHPLQLRVGLHSGPVVAGIIGERVYRYDIWGPTVNLASRMESSCEAGRIQISDQTRLRLNGEFACEERGMVEMKGFGPQRTFWLVGARGGHAGHAHVVRC
ncbi:MAG TPA: adenylate/guanylate cyclase domain-containing protein [Verrucomicrobiota bacterium]|nr:adenylate/guanylate cyclase domain-containing protein [Verrucomicrobiota bacterium]